MTTTSKMHVTWDWIILELLVVAGLGAVLVAALRQLCALTLHFYYNQETKLDVFSSCRGEIF